MPIVEKWDGVEPVGVTWTKDRTLITKD